MERPGLFPAASGEMAVFPLGDLPEICIEKIMSYLGPRKACQLAVVSRLFLAAASSDNLWRGFLPEGHEAILGDSPPHPPYSGTSSARERFNLFLQPRGVLYDNGLKRCFVDGRTGRVGYAMAARAMTIKWVEDKSSWGWKNDHEAWFGECAELLNDCRFEVRGTLSCRLPAGRYRLAWNLRRGDDHQGLNSIATFGLTVGSTGQSLKRRIRFDEAVPECGSGWRKFLVDKVFMGGTEEDEIDFFSMDTEWLWWKSGICMDCIMLYPC